MAKKRIHNPKTGKYYQIRQKTTVNGKKGQIMGAYKNTSSQSRIKRNFGDVLKQLSNE